MKKLLKLLESDHPLVVPVAIACSFAFMVILALFIKFLDFILS